LFACAVLHFLVLGRLTADISCEIDPRRDKCEAIIECYIVSRNEIECESSGESTVQSLPRSDGRPQPITRLLGSVHVFFVRVTVESDDIHVE
jgi:hypothetical protein